MFVLRPAFLLMILLVTVLEAHRYHQEFTEDEDEFLADDKSEHDVSPHELYLKSCNDYEDCTDPEEFTNIGLDCINGICDCTTWMGIKLKWHNSRGACLSSKGHPCLLDIMCHSDKCIKNYEHVDEVCDGSNCLAASAIFMNKWSVDTCPKIEAAVPKVMDDSKNVEKVFSWQKFVTLVILVIIKSCFNHFFFARRRNNNN